MSRTKQENKPIDKVGAELIKYHHHSSSASKSSSKGTSSLEYSSSLDLLRHLFHLWVEAEEPRHLQKLTWNKSWKMTLFQYNSYSPQLQKPLKPHEKESLLPNTKFASSLDSPSIRLTNHSLLSSILFKVIVSILSRKSYWCLNILLYLMHTKSVKCACASLFLLLLWSWNKTKIANKHGSLLLL